MTDVFDNIRIVTWNINGLGDKLGDIDVQNLIKSYEIIVLLETMKGATFVANYPGYCCWHFARVARHKNAKRNSGGFLVMLKEKLAKLSHVSKKSDDVVWVTLRARGNAQCHAGFVYIPPMSSSLNVDECPFEILPSEIIERRATGSIFLAGDFNSRTGNLTDISDTIDFERYPHIMKTRVNDDQSVTTYGKRLLELVRNNNMVIFNGRTCFSNGIINSHFTCFRCNWASVVDYVIADKDTINSIKQFEVLMKPQTRNIVHWHSQYASKEIVAIITQNGNTNLSISIRGIRKIPRPI